MSLSCSEDSTLEEVHRPWQLHAAPLQLASAPKSAVESEFPEFKV